MTTKTYDNNEDGLPILTKKGDDTHTEDGLPILGKSAPAVKKKESSIDYVKTGLEKLGSFFGILPSSTDGKTEPKSITLSPEEETEFNQRMGKVKPVEEHDDDFINDPVKNIALPYRNKILQTSAEYRQSGLRNRPVSESTNLTGTGNKGDLKEAYERDLKHNYHQLEGVTNEVVKQLIPNGKRAVQYVQQQVQKNGGKIPEGNETFNIAAGKAIQYAYLKDKVANGKSLTQIGVDMEREVDPNFDKQISLLEQDANNGRRTGESGMGTDNYDNVIPATTQFNITNRLIHQPDVDLIASENPKVKAELDDLRNGGLYNRFPEGGIAEMSNELSRERMKMGRNNAIANPIFNSSGFMDRLAEKLYRDTPWKLEFYNQHLKGKLQGKLDTPGLVDEFGTGAKETFEQMGASLKDVVGLGDSRAERVYSELEKEGGHVSSGVEGALKWAGQAARFGGMIAAMSTGGGVLKATKLNPTAINAIVAADTFYDTELNAWTMKYPDQPEKAQLGAILTTALFSAGGKVFPSSQVADIAANKMAPEVKAAIANIESGVISKEAKKTLVDKFAQVLKETVKGTGEATAVVAGVNAFENAFDQVAGDPNIIAKYHPDSRILEEAKGMVIGSLFPQLMIAYKGRNAVGNSLLDISERPEVFRQTSKEMMESGKITPEEYNKKLEDITFLSQLKDQLDKFRVDPKNQRRFLVEALNEKNIKERNATLPESAITRRTNKELTRTAEIQERILNGEDVVKSEERAEMPKEELSILDRATESAGEGLKMTLDADHPEVEKVNFLKEQSIDTPNGLKDQLGGNEELVTDIIATNPKTEIQKNIDRFESELKSEDISIERAEEIDKHLTLLEKGLEKNEQKPKVRITAEELEAAQPKENEVIQEPIESPEPAKAGEEATVPPSTPEAGQAPPEIPGSPKEAIVGGESEMTGITHAQMNETAKELGLEPYQEKPETVEQWDAEANERLKKPDSIGKLLKKLEDNRMPTAVEQRMMIRYVASLKAKINANPTPELLSQLDHAKNLSNIVGGRDIAKSLRARQGEMAVEDTLADFLLIRSKDKGRGLTEPQIKEEKEKYERKKKAEAEYEDSLEKDKQKAAEAEFEKETKKRTPRDRKSREEYVSERAKLLIQMKEKWKNAGKDTLSSDIPYRQQLAAIAPEVAKIIKSHIAEGVDNLADLVDKVYEDVKDYVESKKEVRDFIVYGADEKKKVPLSKETIEARDRLIKINKEIEEVRQNDQYENLSVWQKAWDKAQNVLGIRRLVQTSMDASILLRQLGQLAFNPRKWKQFYEAAKATAKIIKSKKNYDRIMFEIKEQPDYAESVKDGVRYNEPEALDSEKRNELYGASRKSFVYKIPILRHLMASSQRIADGTLNVARYELYQKYKKALTSDKITREENPEVYEEMAKLVMNTTGSGNLLGMFENAKAQKVLGSVFYGARLMAANFNSLNPIYYAKITKKNKRLGYEAMKDLASYTATLMATGAALAAAGGNISLDPNSPEFLQFRFGKKVYDITGGKAAYVRTFLRWVEAGHARLFKTKHESTKATEFAAESTMRFFRNKLSPNTSYAYTWSFGQGKNAIGQDADPLEFVKIWPMYADDAWKAAKEDGILSLMTVLLPNLLGIGYNSYYSEPSKQPLEDLIDRNTRSDEQNKELIKNYKEGGREINDKEFEEYVDKRDEEIERMLTILYNEGAYVSENGRAVLKPFKDLSKEEIIRETSIIKQSATQKVKEQLFGKKKETGKQKHSEDKVERERKKLYK